jgi:hypothetical protein
MTQKKRGENRAFLLGGIADDVRALDAGRYQRFVISRTQVSSQNPRHRFSLAVNRHP